MVAASRIQRNDRLTPTDISALLRRIEELERQVEEQRPQQPAASKGRKLIFGQPFTFEGSRDDQKVITWLSKVDNQIRMNARAFGDPLEEEDKIIIAENHLGEIPLRQYNVKIERDGRFTTYKDFTMWIRDFYAPSDLLAHYRQQYRCCRQGKDESVEAYYLRFTELVAKLDKAPDPSWQVSDFVHGLQSQYSDALHLYEDMSDFKTVTTNDIMKSLNRAARLAGNRNKTNEKPVEQRISSNSKSPFKSKKSSNSKETVVAEKLTLDQRRRLERLIEAGGGKFVGKDVKAVQEWVGLSQEKGVCRNCAAKGHFSLRCPLKKNNNGGKGQGQLNALIPGVNSEIQQDLDYLFSIVERTPLAMFPCSIDRTLGIAMLDTGATRIYISLEYAKSIGLRIYESPDAQVVRVPNGQAMRVHGETEFTLQISEWRGKVNATVLDMKTD